MIPELTFDDNTIKTNWEDPKDWEYIYERCDAAPLGESRIPVYVCDNNWVGLGIYKEFKKVACVCDFFDYGYCDNEGALETYLRSYIEDKENNYFVNVGLLSMDDEKYYKHGSYINKDGINTETDYYEYIDEHPEMEIDQQYEGRWLRFSIVKLLES